MENLPIHQDNNELYHLPEFNTEALIDQFIADTQNIRESTKINYRRSLKRYFDWVAISGFVLNKITLTELLIFKKYLENQKTKEGLLLSTYTISAYLSAVKLFYEWANGKSLTMFNPAKSLKSPKRESKFERKPLSIDQCKLLLEHFKKSSIRDFAICNLMIRCGLRTIEVVRIDIEDVDIQNGTRVLMVQGKGKNTKGRFVVLGDKAYFPIEEYLKTKITGDLNIATGPMFTSESITGVAGRLIPGTISKIIKKGLRSIGLNHKKFTAHSLRHTAGTAAIRKGASLDQVQEMLRHASPETTKGYIATVRDEERLTDAAESFLEDAFD